MISTENIENDYSGVETFSQFHDVSGNLPDNLVNEVEMLAQQHPEYSINAVFAILLWKGLDCIHNEENLV